MPELAVHEFALRPIPAHISQVMKTSLPYTLTTKKNCDSHINEHGHFLLVICEACDLRISNGRATGDSFGKITFHSPKGISTVDYFIVSQELMNMFENLVVREPTVSSDHSQLSNSGMKIF